MALPKRVVAQQAETDAIDAAILQELAPALPSTGLTDPPLTAPLTPPAVEAPKPAAVDFEAKYRTLQGMYDAEVPRMHTELRDLRSQIAGLTTKPTPPLVDTSTPLVTSQDHETFGADLLDVVRRQAVDAARVEFSPVIDGLRDENERLKAQLTGVADRVVANDQNAYFAQLTKAVPDWEPLNRDQSFVGWLAMVDPLSGVPRQNYLNDAFEKRDVTRTAALFDAYKAVAVPTAAPTPALNPELERQTSPGTSRADPTTPSTAQQQGFTMAQVTQFYADVRKGAYRGREAEMRTEEAAIDAAVAAGRVTQ